MFYKKATFSCSRVLKSLALSVFMVAIFSNCSKNLNGDSQFFTQSALPAFDLTTFVNVSSLGVSTSSPDNSLALQNAINQNEQIFIPAGTYNIAKPVTKSSGKLIIQADNVIFKYTANFPKASSGPTSGLILRGLTELQINGLTIDGNRVNLLCAGTTWRNYVMGLIVNTCSNVTLTNCAIINSSSISFWIHTSTNVLMSGCSSINGMFHGVDLQGCPGTAIDHFTYKGIGNQGNNTSIGGSGILGTVCDHLKVTNSLIEDCPDTGAKTEGSNDVTWDNNTVRNCGKDGIKFMGHEDDGFYPDIPTVYGARIVNNTVDKIFNGRKDGSSLIQIWNAQNVLVSNNTITGGTKTGLEDGIQVWASTGVTKNVTVSNNRIINTSRFVYISNVSYVHVDSNVCENTIDPLSYYNGFQAEVCHHFNVNGNTFKRHGLTSVNGAGAYFYNCADFTFSSNKVSKANRGIQASLTNSQTVDISKNVWDSLGVYFAEIGVNSTSTIHNLLLNDNVVSRVGAGPILFKLNSTKLTVDHLDLKNTKVVGNGSNSRWGVEVPDGGKIAEADLTNFSTTGLVQYPSVSKLDGCTKIVGLKATAAPNEGTWTVGAIVLNLNFPTLSSVKGWTCTSSGTPGVWKTLL